MTGVASIGIGARAKIHMAATGDLGFPLAATLRPRRPRVRYGRPAFHRFAFALPSILLPLLA
jgi:hypothetical protein